MTKTSTTQAPADTVRVETSEPIKDAIHSGIGAIETTALAAAEIPLSILKSLGVSDEAMESAREGHRQLVHGIRAAVASVADGVTDTTAGIATGIATGFSSAAATAGDAAGRMASSSSSS
ncbi:MAG: hypothetical protein U0S36_12480 [Candidatus Nanopelagicales bacterium]